MRNNHPVRQSVYILSIAARIRTRETDEKTRKAVRRQFEETRPRTNGSEGSGTFDRRRMIWVPFGDAHVDDYYCLSNWRRPGRSNAPADKRFVHPGALCSVSAPRESRRSLMMHFRPGSSRTSGRSLARRGNSSASGVRPRRRPVT